MHLAVSDNVRVNEFEDLNMKRVRVLEIIDHLELAGAQGIVSHLVRAIDRNVFDVRVICLFSTPETLLAKILMEEGYSVYFLNKKKDLIQSFF